MSARWLPVIIATTMSIIIIASALLGGFIVPGGGWRGQGSGYTVSILKSIRIITVTEDQVKQMKTQQTTTSEQIFVSPSQTASRPSSFSTLQESNSKSLNKNSSTSTSNDGDYAASKVTLLGSLNSTGTFTRVRYRFDNVFLETENVISVHLPASIPLPTKPVLVNGVHGASPRERSTTEPPTVFYHRDITQKQEHYLNISYTHISTFQRDEHLRKEPLRKCVRWEARPVYLMHVPHPSNVWHVFNDALMGVFQTLREEGHLPLAEIDEAGNMVEYLEGLHPECHWKMDLYGNGSVYRPEKCLFKTGRLPNSSSSKQSIHCSPKHDDWCRPGVVAFNRSSGPIILMAKGAIWPDRKWRHMFTAISEDIREWDDMVGTCFKELYLVKSHTLDFYTAIYSSYPNYPHAQKQRVGSIQAFQELMATAERHHREVRHKQKPKLHEWGGYSSPGLEILRQGIGPENIGALSVLRDLRTVGIKEGRLKQKDVDKINRMRREETEDMLAFVREKQQMQEEEEEEEKKLRSNASSGARKEPREKEGASAYSQFVPTPSAPRPVVTFMWRMNFKRCAVNEADILTYLLLRYNVTVRVTSFNEPLMETMDLMNSTDILLGMHGAGWTNALFLKRGAAAMQMLPYNWRNPATKTLIRGGSYKAIVIAKEAQYVEWVNPFANYSFFRPIDFDKARRDDPPPYKYSLHPDPDWKVPYALENKIGSHWIYQNTLVKIRDIAVKLDTMMRFKGIVPMPVMVEPVAAVSEAAAAAELGF